MGESPHVPAVTARGYTAENLPTSALWKKERNLVSRLPLHTYDKRGVYGGNRDGG